MTPGGPVRLQALSVFAVFNVLFVWLWWQAVQVEKHPLPDPCSFFNISNMLLTPSHVVDAPPAVEAGEALDSYSPIPAQESCVLSRSVLEQRRNWKWLDEQNRKKNVAPCAADSASVEELLQWTTLLRIVPLCADAEPAAHELYRHLSAIGGEDAPAAVNSGQCTVVPVGSILAAAGQEAHWGSGSANGLLVLRVASQPPPLHNCNFISDANQHLFPDGAAAYAATFTPPHIESENANMGDSQALARLNLFVTSRGDKAGGISFHLGAGSSLLLVIPHSSEAGEQPSTTETAETTKTAEEAEIAGAAKTAAELVVQALGRWVLSPSASAPAADADWRIRLWLLGDGIDNGHASATDTNNLMSSQGKFVSEGASDSQATARMHWDGKAILRTYLGGFVEALSTLVDLSFTSQVVPHSGLQDLDWGHLAPLVLSASFDTKKLSRIDEAALEEAQRRITSLQEEWDSDNEPPFPARSVNLSFYKPYKFPVHLPEGFALAVPFWGFLTFGAPVIPNAESQKPNKNESVTSGFGMSSEEAAVVSGAWIAQLRALLGLQPGATLQNRDACSDGVKESLLCGKECISRRCLWRVQSVETPKSAFSVPPASVSVSGALLAAAEFALSPAKAVLVSGTRSAAVYMHPSPRGLTDWELGGIAADLHFSMMIQAAENIRNLKEVLRSHRDIRVTENVAQKMRRVMQMLECSAEALRMRPCASLRAIALELLNQQNDNDICVAREAKDCAGPRSGSQQENNGVYIRLAMLLARSALKSSKQLLIDGSLEPAPFYSLQFNAAIHVPLLLPFFLPTVSAIVRAVKAA